MNIAIKEDGVVDMLVKSSLHYRDNIKWTCKCVVVIESICDQRAKQTLRDATSERFPRREWDEIVK